MRRGVTYKRDLPAEEPVQPLFGPSPPGPAPEPSALVFACHRCGRPRRITLVGPLPRCPACEDDSAPPADVRATIHAARLAALNLPFRAAQLRAVDDLGRSFEGAAFHVRNRWGTIAVILAMPAVIIAIGAAFIFEHADRESVRVVGATVAPFVLHVLFGWQGRWRRAWRFRTLRAELDVRPERSGVLVCRACGAPLETGNLDETVVKCGHCGSENVWDQRTAADGADREVAAYEALEEHVRARATRFLKFEAVASRIELYAPLLLGIVCLVHAC